MNCIHCRSITIRLENISIYSVIHWVLALCHLCCSMKSFSYTDWNYDMCSACWRGLIWNCTFSSIGSNLNLYAMFLFWDFSQQPFFYISWWPIVSQFVKIMSLFDKYKWKYIKIMIVVENEISQWGASFYHITIKRSISLHEWLYIKYLWSSRKGSICHTKNSPFENMID